MYWDNPIHLDFISEKGYMYLCIKWSNEEDKSTYHLMNHVMLAFFSKAYELSFFKMLPELLSLKIHLYTIKKLAPKTISAE